jgi:hypothetical protein
MTFYDQVQVSPESTAKAILAVCVLYNYLRHDPSMNNFVTENKDNNSSVGGHNAVPLGE